MKIRSIRARLLILLLGATILLWAAATAFSYFEARRELNELFDAQLAESAKVMLLQSRHALHESVEEDEDRSATFEQNVEHQYEQKLHAQIWSRDGRLVYRSSRDLPVEPLVTGIDNGYADRSLHGHEWRVLVLTDRDTGLQIQICESYASRKGVAASIARGMVVPLLLSLPLLALLIWSGTGRGIRPLAALASDLRHRAPENLEPMSEEGLPRELRPMVRSLNGLLSRLHERFEVERRFTSDAAHELRTPLAALKVQAQVAIAARDSSQREHSLQQIVRGIDRTTHLVQQLLTLARLDPDLVQEPAELIDLAEVVRESVAAMESSDDARIRLSTNAGVTIRGSRTLITILARNLIENAARHGGGDVQVEVANADKGVTFSVVDRGRGIPAEERERVFDRFYRTAGSDQRGSGLGLSIVRRIAELHGATIELLGDDGTGLRAVVRFPPLET